LSHLVVLKPEDGLILYIKFQPRQAEF